jgi:outer membrane autotransporter protein
VVPPTSTLIPVLTAIGALSSPAAVVLAVAQLAPSTPGLAAPLVTFQGAREFQNMWLSHLDDVMCNQVSQPEDPTDPTKCPGHSQQGGVWVKGFGYFGDQGSQGAFLGYNSTTLGTMIGYDAPIAPDTRVGLGIGYARSMINAKVFSANTDFNTYQATAYIAYEPGPLFVYGDVSFGWNDYTGTRNIVFPGVNSSAKAAYSGQDYTAYLAAGYHFFADGFTITPMASLQYTHVNLDGYTETGAGSIDLNVNSQSYDFVESRLGVKVAHPFHTSAGALVPEAHFNWLHELANPAVANTAAFVVPGSPFFTTPGMKTAADTLNGGIGVTFLSCSCTARTWSLEAVYDFYWRPDNYTAQQGMIKFTARF